MEKCFSIASFLVSSSNETLVKENRLFGGGAIVESVKRGIKLLKTLKL